MSSKKRTRSDADIETIPGYGITPAKPVVMPAAHDISATPWVVDAATNDDVPEEVVSDGAPVLTKKQMKQKKKKQKKRKEAALRRAGITIKRDMLGKASGWRRLAHVSGEQITASRNIEIGEQILTFAPVVSSRVHPHEGVSDKEGNVRLEHTTGVHMLQMFAECGFQWEKVAYRLMPDSMVRKFLVNLKEEVEHMVSGNAMMVGQTIGTLLMLIASTDKWVVEQLGDLQTTIDSSLLLQGVDPWLYAVIHAMRVSNTHSMVDPIVNHGHSVMSTYPGLTRVFSMTGDPKDFNAILMLGCDHALHVFAMRPIPAGGRVVVILSDAMAVNRGDQTNVNILNLLMALRKMTGETFEASILAGVIESLGTFDVPNTDDLPAALKLFHEDQETFERIREQLMNVDVFKRSLASYEQKARQIQTEVKAKTAAIRDTIVAILGTINMHTSDPNVWLDAPDIVDDDLVRNSSRVGKSCTLIEGMDASSSDESSDDMIDEADFAVLTSRNKKKKKKRKVPSPTGITVFYGDAVTEEIEPYCMFTAVLLCSYHAELDASALPWIPDGVLSKLDTSSAMSYVSSNAMDELLAMRVESELKSIYSAFANVDPTFIDEVSRKTKMANLTGSANEMIKMMSVLNAVSEEDDNPVALPEEDDDEAKDEDVIDEEIDASLPGGVPIAEEIVIVPEFLEDELIVEEGGGSADDNVSSLPPAHSS